MALAVERQFQHPHGMVRPGSLQVRFGEVEQRGVALTAAGRDLSDWMVAQTDARLAAAPAGSRTRVDMARGVWQENLPATERELALQGPAFFTYAVGRSPASDGAAVETDSRSLRELVEAGVLVPEPIVYEDFLPRSAAGIFQSNLTEKSTRDDQELGTPYDIDVLPEFIGRPIADPTDLYAAQQQASLDAPAQALGLTTITVDRTETHEETHEHRVPHHRRDHGRCPARVEGHRRRRR